MKKMIIALAIASVVPGFFAHADDGEGLTLPRKGTCDRVAYDAADAQYAKDDGNNAYHLQGINLVDGGVTYSKMSVEVDFYSAEDGEYDYQVDMKVSNSKSGTPLCTVEKVKATAKNN